MMKKSVFMIMVVAVHYLLHVVAVAAAKQKTERNCCTDITEEPGLYKKGLDTGCKQ